MTASPDPTALVTELRDDLAKMPPGEREFWAERLTPMFDLIAKVTRERDEARRDAAAEEGRHWRVVQGFAEVCEAVGVRFDAPEAVAYEINAKIGNAKAALTAAEADKERYRAALRPFADAANGLAPDLPETDQVLLTVGGLPIAWVYTDQLRRAALLEKEQGDGQ